MERVARCLHPPLPAGEQQRQLSSTEGGQGWQHAARPHHGQYTDTLHVYEVTRMRNVNNLCLAHH